MLRILIDRLRAKIVTYEKSSVFVEQMLEAENTLVECILASFLLGDSDIMPSKKSMFIKLNRTICLEV